MRRPLKLLAIIVVALLLVSLIYPLLAGAQRPVVRLATTTSIYDSGLIDEIIAAFEKKHNVRIMVIPVGSGQALELARRGETDLVIVHSRDQELEFVKSGFGIHRIGIMYNDFVIVGPVDDPARIRGTRCAVEAFRKISESQSRFISRADMSGTHMMELSIWRSIGVMPSPAANAWYIEAGRGMGSLLRMADEMGAYTLVDRATWASYKGQLRRLTLLVECDPPLYNPYSLILVNPERNPNVNFKGAVALGAFLVSRSCQELIGSFRRGGEPIFKPLAWNISLAERLGYPNQAEELAWYLVHGAYEESISNNVYKSRDLFLWEVLNITALSLEVSLISVTIGSAIGIPIGAFLGLRRFGKKKAISRLVEVTLKTSVNTLMGLPPVVAGLLVFMLFNRSGPLGHLGLLYTPTAMIIAQVILVTPIIVGITMSAIAEVEETIRERALSLGATERQAAWAVIREAKGGIITAIIVAFGAAISEVGGILIAGGNIRWYTRTLTTAIITEVELGNFNAALALGAILLSIAFIINLALTIMQIRSRRT